MDAAAKITAELEEKERQKPHMITLGTGVVILLRPVSRNTMMDIAQKITKGTPVPPTVHIESRDRDEQNPSDPTYMKAVEEFKLESYKAFNDAMLLLGTTAQQVPGGFPKWDDEGWEEELEALDLEVPKQGKKRYLAWLKHKAVLGDEDLKKIMDGVSEISGMIPEGKVAEAADQFPGPS